MLHFPLCVFSTYTFDRVSLQAAIKDGMTNERCMQDVLRQWATTLIGYGV